MPTESVKQPEHAPNRQPYVNSAFIDKRPCCDGGVKQVPEPFLKGYGIWVSDHIISPSCPGGLEAKAFPSFVRVLSIRNNTPANTDQQSKTSTILLVLCYQMQLNK
jgi:hypothetical protein